MENEKIMNKNFLKIIVTFLTMISILISVIAFTYVPINTKLNDLKMSFSNVFEKQQTL